MRPRISIPLTALVLLCLLQAHRILLASVILDAGAALAPPARPLGFLAALLPLALLALPLLPLPLTRSRRQATALAAALTAVARVAAASPQSHAAGLAAALAMAAAAIYLGTGVGLLARRSVAGGAALALCLDVLVRWLGTPGPAVARMLIPAAEALPLLALAALSLSSETRPVEGLERRAGGLRLRGAVALGAILFLESSALAAPWAAARGGAFAPGLLAPGLAAVSLGAALWLLAGGGPARLYRPRLVLMGARAGTAAKFAGALRGPAAAVLLVAGHLCALLLLGRALAPASGRRGAWTGAGVLATLALLDGLLALATAAPPELIVRATPWVHALAALLLVAALVLIPRPAPADPLLPRAVARVALALGLALGLALALAATQPRGGAPPVPKAQAAS